MIDITDHFSDRSAGVRERVRSALSRAGRPADDAILVAVSKGQSVGAVQAAYRAGQRDFGESYVQEGVEKIAALDAADAVWHFIGRIQSNKTRAIAERFDWVHTLDRERIAARLAGQRPTARPPLNVLIQVNVGGEPQKAGVAPHALRPLAEAASRLPGLKLRGLMTIPPAGLAPSEGLAHFRRLAALHRELADEGYGVDTLSMGMSHDFEVAIEAGANCIRVGTAIFGPRS